jgi:alpha-beta hydrolase superfamily lysophospholipase
VSKDQRPCLRNFYLRVLKKGFLELFTTTFMIEAFQLFLTDRTLAGVLHLPEKRQSSPWVVVCHGLFSSMASEKFTHLAELLCRSGIAALRFDFSGCGASTGSIADTTVTRRLQELEAVVGFADSHAALGRDCALMGSSLGGFVGLLFAARRPFKALSLWATPYDLAVIKDNIPTQELRLLKPDFFTDAAGYCLDARQIDIPMQIIHGTRDEIVPVSHADRLCSRDNPRHQLVIIPGADHSISKPQHRKKALDASCLWLQQHLNCA